MKLTCLQCGHKFEGGICYDELGWHSSCPECGGSFDVDVPEGRIVMAFTDRVDDEENPYKNFTDRPEDAEVFAYYAFNTVRSFVRKWRKLMDSHEPQGMWYWVMDEGYCVTCGAFDSMDIELFKDFWGSLSK